MWGCHGASLRGCFFAGALYDGKMKTEHCCKCRIKGCIEDKGLAYCYECPEHPCRLTKDLEKSYMKRYQISLVENSDHLIAPSDGGLPVPSVGACAAVILDPAVGRLWIAGDLHKTVESGGRHNIGDGGFGIELPVVLSGQDACTLQGLMRSSQNDQNKRQRSLKKKHVLFPFSAVG